MFYICVFFWIIHREEITIFTSGIAEPDDGGNAAQRVFGCRWMANLTGSAGFIRTSENKLKNKQ